MNVQIFSKFNNKDTIAMSVDIDLDSLNTGR